MGAKKEHARERPARKISLVWVVAAEAGGMRADQRRNPATISFWGGLRHLNACTKKCFPTARHTGKRRAIGRGNEKSCRSWIPQRNSVRWGKPAVRPLGGGGFLRARARLWGAWLGHGIHSGWVAEVSKPQNESNC